MLGFKKKAGKTKCPCGRFASSPGQHDGYCAWKDARDRETAEDNPQVTRQFAVKEAPQYADLPAVYDRYKTLASVDTSGAGSETGGMYRAPDGFGDFATQTFRVAERDIANRSLWESTKSKLLALVGRRTSTPEASPEFLEDATNLVTNKSKELEVAPEGADYRTRKRAEQFSAEVKTAVAVGVLKNPTATPSMKKKMKRYLRKENLKYRFSKPFRSVALSVVKISQRFLDRYANFFVETLTKKSLEFGKTDRALRRARTTLVNKAELEEHLKAQRKQVM